MLNWPRRLWRRMMCKHGRHAYYVVREYTPAVRKVGCRYCNGLWGMNDRVKAFIEWDGDMEEAHREAYPQRLQKEATNANL